VHSSPISNVKVLDPACGSGNFLYLALRALKDLEHKANLEAEQLGLHRQVSIEVSPANVLGIELNPYAAELARVTVWIGEIQWMLKNGYPIRKNPILQPLDHIENRDALLAPSPSQGEGWDGGAIVEAHWPTVDAIIGNPPFLGGSKMRGELGDEYTEALRNVYEGRVPGGADLVTYWFEKARAQIEAGKCQRAGLVATNSIRGGANQKALARILDNTSRAADTVNHYDDHDFRHAATDQLAQASGHPGGTSRGRSSGDRGSANQSGNERTSGQPTGESPRAATHGLGSAQMDDGRTSRQRALAGGKNLLLTPLRIFNAWSDEPWINDGAAVRVSLVCFGNIEGAILDGNTVETIHADLTSGEGLNLTQAKQLKENAGVCFMGASKKAPFDIPGELARQWLKLPNPNGRPNSDVVRPWANGMDITRRASDTWIVDFGTDMSEADAALYETPFEYVVQHVKPEREKNNREAYRKYWWRHAEARPGMRAALKNLPRYIATPHVSKHRVFVWVNAAVLPDQMLIVTARSDDTTFGILHSRFHELWSLRMGTWMGAGNDPRYTPTTTFETFSFPEGLTPNLAPANHNNPAAAEIAAAAQKLNTSRDNWLNPPEWVDWVRTPEEEKAGYPARPVAKTCPLPNPLPHAGEGANVKSNLSYEADLKKRTLTNLYNQRPAWLDNAHKTLDAAVAKAYGWNDYTPEMPDEEVLRRLLVLNLARS